MRNNNQIKNLELKNPEFKRLVAKFERELAKEGKPEEYYTEHADSIKELLYYVEKKEVKSIKAVTPELVKSFVKYLEKRPNYRRGGTLSVNTINKRKGAINRFWKFLEMEEYEVYSISLRLAKRDKKQPQVYSKEEIKYLYSVTDDTVFGIRDRCMLALYYGCGLRRKEGHRLILQDFDFGKGRVLVRDTKNGRDRYVMFSPKVQEMIEDYVNNARDLYLPEGSQSDRLFIGERGKPLNYASLKARMMTLAKRVKEKYGITKTLDGIHSLRHSLGTHLYMAGMNIERIAFMLGHQTLDTTQLYIHSSNELGNAEI